MKLFFQGLLAGGGIFVISIAISFLTQFFMPGITIEYTNQNIFRPWSDPIMSLFYVYPFVLGIILSFVWDKTKKLMKDEEFYMKGLKFGFWYWIASSIPGMFITFSSFQVSLPLVISWSIGGFFEAVAAGLIFSKVNK